MPDEVFFARYIHGNDAMSSHGDAMSDVGRKRTKWARLTRRLDALSKATAQLLGEDSRPRARPAEMVERIDRATLAIALEPELPPDVLDAATLFFDQVSADYLGKVHRGEWFSTAECAVASQHALRRSVREMVQRDVERLWFANFPVPAQVQAAFVDEMVNALFHPDGFGKSVNKALANLYAALNGEKDARSR